MPNYEQLYHLMVNASEKALASPSRPQRLCPKLAEKIAKMVKMYSR